MPVLNIDCREGLLLFPDNSIDAIVTDPPYELGCTYHRMTCAIEDAGFELSEEYTLIANARIDAA